MVMGQEERKNKAKLEKTQISLAASNTEYENAVKALEDTTARWNREWKAAADKFQDLEEERLDFTKSSLWTFANVASTVCVSDDASCEKIRLSLEGMEVEKDIVTFIKERGTGQEIPDPPKYINFCRGDIDSQSEASEDESYAVAQFPRSINPAFRSSSPQPSTYESHHDPNSTLAKNLGHLDIGTPPSREVTVTPQKVPAMPPQETERPRQKAPSGYQPPRVNNVEYDPTDFAPVPHDPYPLEGMTMLCRPPRPTAADLRPTGSDLSSAPSQRPSSRDSHSEYSNPTSFSSQEPPSGKVSPAVVKQAPPPVAAHETKLLKKKSGFFQNHSPFGRKKSVKEVAPANRNTWHAAAAKSPSRPQLYGRDNNQNLLRERTASPDPIAANASLALNVGQNVFPVQTPDRKQKGVAQPPPPEDDPIALALAELKGVTVGKQSAVRMSADHYHGIATPAPGSQPHSRSVPVPGSSSAPVAAGMRGTPPPSYDQQVQVQRLGVPPPAVTSKAMKESSQRFQEQTRSMFSPNRPGSGGYGGSMSRPGTRGSDMPRAASPAPPRSASPRPGSRADYQQQQQSHRSASPNPYGGSQRGSTSRAPTTPNNRSSDQGYYRHASPNDIARSASPSPYAGGRGDYARPGSSHDMAMQLAQAPEENYGSQRGRHHARSNTSPGNRAMSFYEGSGAVQPAPRQRSKSIVDPSRQYTKDGRPILHFGKLQTPLAPKLDAPCVGRIWNLVN